MGGDAEHRPRRVELRPCRRRTGGRPEAARRAGLEDVEKLLTSITSESALAFG
jgi:hypothetical protein